MDPSSAVSDSAKHAWVRGISTLSHSIHPNNNDKKERVTKYSTEGASDQPPGMHASTQHGY